MGRFDWIPLYFACPLVANGKASRIQLDDLDLDLDLDSSRIRDALIHTLRRCCLSSAAAVTSSQLIPNSLRSFVTSTLLN